MINIKKARVENEMHLWHKGTIRYVALSAAPKAPDNQPLNYSPDLSGHWATPPLILPDKNADILIDLLSLIISSVYHTDWARLADAVSHLSNNERPSHCDTNLDSDPP